MNKLWALAAALLVFGTAAQAQEGDPTRGEVVTKRCIACHTFEQNGANKVGPNLWGIMTRGVASLDGYNYSKELTAASENVEQWNEADLLAYLNDPTAWIRTITDNAQARSKMTFKLPDEGQRRDVIAYMKTLQ